MSENTNEDEDKNEEVSIQDVLDERDLLQAFINSIISTYGTPKSNIIDPNSNKVQIDMNSSDYIESLVRNISSRVRDLNEILIALN